MVNNVGYGYRACSNEASSFVCWMEESPTGVMGVVEDGDHPCASHHEDSVEGLIELCPAMFRLPDSFTVVSELKRAVQEVWRSMMVIFLALRVLLGGR